MSDDVIERLRESCAMHVDLDGRKEVAAAIDAVEAALLSNLAGSDVMLREAIRTIERQTVEIDGLRAEDKRLRERLDLLVRNLRAAIDERDKAEAEVRRLRRERDEARALLDGEMLERIMPAVGALVEGEHLTTAEWQAAEDAWREWRGEVDDESGR